MSSRYSIFHFFDYGTGYRIDIQGNLEYKTGYGIDGKGNLEDGRGDGIDIQKDLEYGREDRIVQGQDQAKVLGGAGGWGPLLVSCEGQTTLRDIGITMISLSFRAGNIIIQIKVI